MTGGSTATPLPANHRHTLLVVDDEPDVLESLRHLFHRRYRVKTSESGAEAIKILQNEDVHVILSDQRMPGMSGDALLRLAREDFPDAIRLLFTGYADIQAVVNAVNQGGIYRYIHKPWDVAELEAVVGQAMAQYDLLADRRRLVEELQQANARLIKANRDLAETDELKTAFLEVASHEFNTPITIVQGLSEMLKLVNPDREPHEREIVEQIAESAAQLARLVSNTLKLSRAGDYRNQLRTESTDLTRLLREVAAQASPFAEARQLHFHVEIADDLGPFELNPDKIRDAVINLLTNAIKFTPDGGDVRFSARLASNGAEIEVADRGIGLEPRALARLFDPFFTEFDAATHSSGEFGFRKRGLGLGLSLVKRFIELHGGHVAAESSPGQGTRVVAYVPRSRDDETR